MSLGEKGDNCDVISGNSKNRKNARSIVISPDYRREQKPLMNFKLNDKRFRL